MAQHTDLGKLGEELAAVYLIQNGYSILHRNWRRGKFEIDLVATKNGMLHFVEVKARSSSMFGNPEQNVSRKKIRALLNGIDAFLFHYPQFCDFHIDILSVTTHQSGETEYFFIEDIYL